MKAATAAVPKTPVKRSRTATAEASLIGTPIKKRAKITKRKGKTAVAPLDITVRELVKRHGFSAGGLRKLHGFFKDITEGLKDLIIKSDTN